MIKETARTLATLSFILLLALGCATVRTRPQVKEDSIAAQQLVKTTRSWDGKLLPAYPPGQPEVTIRRIILPAGARLETHSHPVINAGLLVSGQLTVINADGKTLHLKAGDPIVELVNTLHYGINEGRVPAEIVIVYAGAADMPITVIKQ
jgi:quercetin dioxygenase-like cupin family protein